MATIVFRAVSKVYPDGTRALNRLDLDIRDGEFLVLVGPSGCGKTTALRIAAGLEDVSDGQIEIDGDVVNDLPSRSRDVAMVFQSYALYPHLTVRSNIGFGLQLRKRPPEEIALQVEAAADVLGLTDYLSRKPGRLSGGQRQRVAMGRAIVRAPRAFLMDEPLSNLDAKLRVQVRGEIARIQRRLGITTLYVTHDQTEAMTLGHRVAVMKHGVLQQIAPPQEIYDNPANVFVAGFIGSPPMNLLRATLYDGPNGSALLELGRSVVRLHPGVLAATPGLRGRGHSPVVVGIRPEDLEHVPPERIDDPRAGLVLIATLDLVESLGSEVLAYFPVEAPPVDTQDVVEVRRDLGVSERATPGERPTTLVVARLGPQVAVRAGSVLAVGVPVERLHFFDAGTGASLREPAAPAESLTSR